MFGYGRVLTSGCGYKTLVRIGGGNLKPVVVFVVMGISAFATLKSIAAVWRVNTVDARFIDMPAGANLHVLHIPGLGYIVGTAILFWVLRYKDVWNFDGLLAVAGVVMGSAAALVRHTFRWDGFTVPFDLGQHLLGRVLMGVGGVTAMGCTLEQGLSGVSTLSLNALFALASIVAGAVRSLQLQAAHLERAAHA